VPVNDDTPRYACAAPGCPRTDLTLTKNGRVRSHASNGKKAGPDNPNCPGGSDYPAGHSGAAVAPATASGGPTPTVVTPSGGPNPFRRPLPTGNLPHDRRSDEPACPGCGHTGHAGFCEACGCLDNRTDEEKANGYEPEDPATAAAYGREVHTLAPGDRNHDDTLGTCTRCGEPRDGHAHDDTPRTDADAFLDGEPGGDDDPEGGTRAPHYFPAKFDGSCDQCGTYFNEGDDIFRGDGGWWARGCCGPDAVDMPDRPVAVARTLPVRNGRYVFPDPVTGKERTGSRASKYAEGIADNYNLMMWQVRMALLGMALRPDLVGKVMSAIGGGVPHEVAKAKKTYLNKIGEEAQLTAGSKTRAKHGTVLHKHTEELDAGTRALADVPDDYRTDAAAYVEALEYAGFRPVKHLIERTVFISELGVAGTFDRVLECTRDTEVIDLDGRQVQIRAGEFVIGDVKSGTDLKYAWPEILVQEAIYAHAINENGIAVCGDDGIWRWVPLELGTGSSKVREDVGVVMHVPFGEGRADLRYADLITGWRGAKLCQANKEYFKVKMPKQPVMSLMPTDVPGAAFVKELAAAVGDPGTAFAKPSAAQLTGHPSVKAGTTKEKEEPVTNTETRNWEEEFRAVRTKDAANTLWREAKDTGVPAAELARMVTLVDLTPAPPTWDERAAAVTDRAAASALFKEARAAVMEGKPDMNVAKLNALTSIMREALAKTG